MNNFDRFNRFNLTTRIYQKGLYLTLLILYSLILAKKDLL